MKRKTKLRFEKISSKVELGFLIQKIVSCDDTGINTENGIVNTSQVSVTRSEATQSWSEPVKCDVTCNAGYEKRANQCVKSRPPRNIVAVKCDANINQLTYDGGSESLSALRIHDGYYAEFSSMPSHPTHPKLEVDCPRGGSAEMSLAEGGMHEESIRSELRLTENDSVSIYHCSSEMDSVCGGENNNYSL